MSSISYSPVGELVREVVTFSGGQSITHYRPKEDGKPSAIKQGAFEQWIQGQRTCQGCYENNQKHGQWTYFQYGLMVAEEWYEADLLVEQRSYFQGRCLVVQKFDQGALAEYHRLDEQGQSAEIIYWREQKMVAREWYHEGEMTRQELYA